MLTLGHVIPRLVGGVWWSYRHAPLFTLGEAWVQGVLVELGHLVQRNTSRDGRVGGEHRRQERVLRGVGLLGL